MNPNSTRILHIQFLAKNKLKKSLPLNSFARVLELADKGTHGATDIAREVPGTYPRLINKIAGEVGLTVPKTKALASKEPELVAKYLEFRRSGSSIASAARRVGVSFSTGQMWDTRHLHERTRHELEASLRSQAKTHEERPLIRKILAIKNPDGSFRYSKQMIATVFEVREMTVRRANNSPSQIRPPEEGEETADRFRRMKRQTVRELYAEAREQVRKLRVEEEQRNMERLRNLNLGKKAELGQSLKKAVDLIGWNGNSADALIAKGIVDGIVAAPSMQVSQRIISQIYGITQERVLKLTAKLEEAEIVTKNGNTIAINHRTVKLLRT
ncbi:MAG: hypothetical protein HY544_04810 [Candidatus Diapherotrites archaeon]|uniref:Uncharacterized protein n=1 Tax=Candidatus Iainarchaeum sp. TaxID=3101447 RepID=A0A8T3YRP0_9ARCH|nr:hypothetical protein [Candidatus Diapherotrites archaeon]